MINDLVSLFWFCALAGTGLFVIQFILSFDDHDGFDAGKFKWLTKQAIAGFLMMFGWVGLACKNEFGLTSAPSVILGLMSGTGAMFVAAMIFHFAKKLHSSGTVFRIEDAVGKQGTVYQNINKGRAGKITLSMNDMTHEIDAISLTGEDLPSFTSVHIVKKADERTVAVIRLET